VPCVLAARTYALGYFGNAAVQRCDRKFMLGHW
jgi:hypothetical protein